MRKYLLFLAGLIGLLTTAMAQSETDSLSARKNTNFIILPAFGYSPETNFSYGAVGFFVFEDKRTDSLFYRPSSLTPIIVYTSNNQLLSKTELDLFTKKGLNINMIGRYFRFPDFYYGIGNETDPDVRERYDDNFFRLEGRITRSYMNNFFYGLSIDLQHNEISGLREGGLLQTQNPNGLEGGRVIGIGPTFRYDTRNSTIYPTGGKQIGLSITSYNQWLGSEYNYVLYSFDYRQYFELFGPNNILALQFRTNLTTGGDVPFYKLNTIAGDNRLRGFDHKNVFRDEQGAYFQVEGRQKLFWRLGGVLFAGVGQVFERVQNISLDQYRFVYGFGGRLQALKDKQMNIRMDVGFSNDGQNGIFLSVREAF